MCCSILFWIFLNRGSAYPKYKTHVKINKYKLRACRCSVFSVGIKDTEDMGAAQESLEGCQGDRRIMRENRGRYKIKIAELCGTDWSSHSRVSGKEPLCPGAQLPDQFVRGKQNTRH